MSHNPAKLEILYPFLPGNDDRLELEGDSVICLHRLNQLERRQAQESLLVSPELSGWGGVGGVAL